MEVPATSLSTPLRSELAQECATTEHAYLRQLYDATDLAQRLVPSSDQLKAELNLSPALDLVDTWLSRLSGFVPGTFKLLVMRDPKDLAAADRDQIFDLAQMKSGGGISFVTFGLGFVFTDRISEDPPTPWQVLRAAAHELAHMHALNLLRIAFITDEAGTVSPQMLMTPGFTLSRNGGGHLRYEHINEYWAEMAALQALHQLHNLPFDASIVTGRFGEHELTGPRYAAEQSMNGSTLFTIAGLIAGTFGAADRAHNWQLWHAVADTVARMHAFDPVLVDGAMRDLAGENALEVLDRVMTDVQTISSVAALLMSH